MGRVWIGARELVEHLRRLSVVLAVPIRLKIVNELYQREMSPKQFQEEFGGGSVSRIAKHFERLRETGWLILVRKEGPGGERRGGVETIYRATELAFCDRPTWAALPHSMRVAFSWNTFKEIAELFREALEASTFHARAERRLTGTRFLFDEAGWKRVADAVGEEFSAHFDEQDNARRRADRTGEKLFRATSLLLAFELPIKEGFQFHPALVEGEELMIPFPVRVSKVFEDELCLQIVDEANRGNISVPMFYKKYGARFELDEKTIRRRFKKLEKYGWIKVVDQETGGRRRGATERFYHATGPALYNKKESPWAKVSGSLAKTDYWRTFVQLSDWVKAALLAGTLTRHEETCLALPILHLDQEGWERLVASLEKLHGFILKEQELAEERLRESGGDDAMAIVIALGAFEVPAPVKEP